MFYVYILYSKRINMFYTGQSVHPDVRLEEHNRGKTPFMASGMPWERVFLKELGTRSEAVLLEKTIKKRGAARFLSDNNLKVG
jgi:putative endonuclease